MVHILLRTEIIKIEAIPNHYHHRRHAVASTIWTSWPTTVYKQLRHFSSNKASFTSPGPRKRVNYYCPKPAPKDGAEVCPKSGMCAS
jgi:hypothetical protein